MKLKKARKNKTYQFAYVSLFGKTNIDEVNTELYNQIHPHKKNLGKVFGIAAKLAEIGTSIGANRQISLSGNVFNKKIKIKKEKKIIVFIDDLERKSDSIPADVFVGYINDLILQGVKVVALSNLSKASSEVETKQFEEYKEKVFDRVYQAKETQADFIHDMLRASFGSSQGTVHEGTRKKLEEICDHNLRMIKKVDILFNQIKKATPYDAEFSSWYDLYTLCALVVVEDFNNKYSKLYKEKIEKIDWKDKAREECQKTKGILCYLEDNKISFGYSQNDLNSAGGIYDLIEGNYEMVRGVFGILREDNFFLTSSHLKYHDTHLSRIKQTNEARFNIQSNRSEFFSASDDKKKKLLKKQNNEIIKLFQAIENSREKNDWRGTPEKAVLENMLDAYLSEWLHFADFNEYPFTEAMEDELFKYVRENYFDLETRIESKSAEKFKLRYYTRYYIPKRVEYDQGFIKKQPSGIRMYGSSILSLRKLPIDKSDNQVDKLMEKFFIDNNFFIDNLSGDISLKDWYTACEICDFIKKNFQTLKDEIIKYLEEYRKKNANDKSLQQRLGILIRELGDNPLDNYHIDGSMYFPHMVSRENRM